MLEWWKNGEFLSTNERRNLECLQKDGIDEAPEVPGQNLKTDQCKLKQLFMILTGGNLKSADVKPVSKKSLGFIKSDQNPNE